LSRPAIKPSAPCGFWFLSRKINAGYDVFFMQTEGCRNRCFQPRKARNLAGSSRNQTGERVPNANLRERGVRTPRTCFQPQKCTEGTSLLCFCGFCASCGWQQMVSASLRDSSTKHSKTEIFDILLFAPVVQRACSRMNFTIGSGFSRLWG
jgi:hypothetical protein